MKTALICGAGGFIGSHLVKRLKNEGFWVRGVDLKFPEFAKTEADDFVIGDLRDQSLVRRVIDQGLTWVVLVLFSLAIMMRILCTTLV